MNRREFLTKAAVGGAVAGAAVMTTGGLASAAAPEKAAPKRAFAPKKAAPAFAPHLTVGDPSVNGYEIGNLAWGYGGKDQYNRSWSGADFVGNWVLLNFSAIWCGPCQFQSAGARAFASYVNGLGAPEPFACIEILIDDQIAYRAADAFDAERWAVKFGTFREPILHLDGGANTNMIFELLGYTYANSFIGGGAYPTNVLIDPAGIVRYVVQGWSGEYADAIADYIVPGTPPGYDVSAVTGNNPAGGLTPYNYTSTLEPQFDKQQIKNGAVDRLNEARAAMAARDFAGAATAFRTIAGLFQKKSPVAAELANYAAQLDVMHTFV